MEGGLNANNENYMFLKFLQFVFQIYKHSIPFVLNIQQLLEQN